MELLFLRESEPPTVGEGRTIVARVCTYDRVYQVSPTERERVRRGAFKSPLARPSGLIRFRHIGERPGDVDDPNLIYGGVKMLREDAGTVLAECEVVEGPKGDHLLALVRSKAIQGVSMSAIVSESKLGRDGIRDVIRVSAFNGLSLTPEPAYDDAGVLALREQSADIKKAIKLERERNAETARRLRALMGQ